MTNILYRVKGVREEAFYPDKGTSLAMEALPRIIKKLVLRQRKGLQSPSTREHKEGSLGLSQ